MSQKPTVRMIVRAERERAAGLMNSAFDTVEKYTVLQSRMSNLRAAWESILHLSIERSDEQLKRLLQGRAGQLGDTFIEYRNAAYAAGTRYVEIAEALAPSVGELIDAIKCLYADNGSAEPLRKVLTDAGFTPLYEAIERTSNKGGREISVPKAMVGKRAAELVEQGETYPEIAEHLPMILRQEMEALRAKGGETTASYGLKLDMLTWIERTTGGREKGIREKAKNIQKAVSDFQRTKLTQQPQL